MRLRDRFLGNAVEDQVYFEFLIVNKVTIGLRFRRRSIFICPEASSFSNTRRFISRLTPYRANMTLVSENVVLFVFQASAAVKSRPWRRAFPSPWPRPPPTAVVV